MNVFIDTNILLDVLCKRKPFYPDSYRIFQLCEAGLVNGNLSALSIADIVYILRKELNPDKIKEIINTIFLIFKVSDLKADDLQSAASLHFDDYEDALQTICAKRTNSSYIISRNTKDFVNSDIPVLTPAEFCNLFD